MMIVAPPDCPGCVLAIQIIWWTAWVLSVLGGVGVAVVAAALIRWMLDRDRKYSFNRRRHET